MITTGFVLAVLTGTGFYMIYKKLPPWMKRFMVEHPLMTEVITCVATYGLFGGTLVALFASAWLGILETLFFSILANPKAAAAIQGLGEKIEALKNATINMIADMAAPSNEVKTIAA